MNTKPKKVRTISANALTRHALRIFDLCGFTCWRQNNGGVYDPVKKVFRRNSSTPGISDIIGYHRRTGQFLACEVKVGKDRLSIEQQRFLTGVRLAGGTAIELRSMYQLEQFLKDNKSFS